MLEASHHAQHQRKTNGSGLPSKRLLQLEQNLIEIPKKNLERITGPLPAIVPLEFPRQGDTHAKDLSPLDMARNGPAKRTFSKPAQAKRNGRQLPFQTYRQAMNSLETKLLVQ